MLCFLFFSFTEIIVLFSLKLSTVSPSSVLCFSMNLDVSDADMFSMRGSMKSHEILIKNDRHTLSLVCFLFMLNMLYANSDAEGLVLILI